MIRFVVTFLALSGLAFVPAVGLSQTLAIAESLEGQVVAPKGELTLRAEPPGTFFKAKGTAIGVASPTEEYRVLDVRSVPTIFGRQQWLRVQSTDEPSQQGWVFNGDGASVANVVMAD